TDLKELYDHSIHLVFRTSRKGKMGKTDKDICRFFGNIGPLHDFKRSPSLESDEIRGKSFLRIHILLVAFPVEILDIEITRTFQFVRPDSDMSQLHMLFLFTNPATEIGRAHV